MNGQTRAALRLLASFVLPLSGLSAGAEEPSHLTAGQVDKAVRELDALAAKQIQGNTVPGLAIAVIFQDKVVYAKGFGVRDVNGKATVNADTVFQLASVSKPVGATVVAALVGEGKITWDSKLHDLDPAFEMFDPWVTREITIRDMYAHRSGLPDHAGDLLEDFGFGRAEVLRRLRYQPPESSFRSHYAYTNFGLTAAAVAAAKASGAEWETLSEEKLYKPLGMSSTSSRYSDFAGRANKALGHVLVQGKWVQKFQRHPDPQSPAGGVSSSVNDMAKWVRLELADGKFEGKTIVNEKALNETRQPQIVTSYSPFTGLPSFYGLGWNVSYDEQGRLRLNHSGAFALGAATHVNLVPGEHLGVVVLTNAYPVGVAEALGTIFIETALYGKPTQDWFPLYKKLFTDPAMFGVATGFDYAKTPATPAPALKTDAYVGTYSNDFFGDLSITKQGDRLVMALGPQHKTFPMQHYDRDTFTWYTESEDVSGTSGIIFTIGGDGRASQLTVENLNADGRGTFRRIPSR
jgi:CubicO group peptidase (beta-lactamase class C family)